MARVIHRFKWGNDPSLGSQLGNVFSGLGNIAKGIGTLMPARDNPLALALAEALGGIAGGGQQQPGAAPAGVPSAPGAGLSAPLASALPQQQATPAMQPATAMQRRAAILQKLVMAGAKGEGGVEAAFKIAELLPEEQLAQDAQIIPMSRFPDIDPSLQSGVLVVSPNGTTQVVQPEAGKAPANLEMWALTACAENPESCQGALQLAQRVTLATTKPTAGDGADRPPAQVQTWQWLLAQDEGTQQAVGKLVQLLNPTGEKNTMDALMADLARCSLSGQDVQECIADRTAAGDAVATFGAISGSSGEPGVPAATAEPAGITAPTPAQIQSYAQRAVAEGVDEAAVAAALVEAGADPAAVASAFAQARAAGAGPSVPLR